MPLNEQEIAEIKTALTNGAELPAHIKPLYDLGLNIRTPKQEEEFKTNFLNTEIGKTLKNTHDLYDKDVFELTGVEKKPSEKSYEYMKRAFSETKTSLSGNAAKLEKELKELKEKQGAGNANDVDKKRIEQLEGLLSEKDKKYNEEITGLKSALEKKDVDFELNTALAKLENRFKKTIEKTVLDDVIATRLEKIKATAKRIDGKTVFVNEKGDVLTNTSTYKPFTAEEIIAETFKDLLEKQQQQSGAGSPQDGKGAAEKMAGDPMTWVPPIDTIKTRVQLTNWLMEQGLSTTSKEYNELFKKFGDKLPLR